MVIRGLNDQIDGLRHEITRLAVSLERGRRLMPTKMEPSWKLEASDQTDKTWIQMSLASTTRRSYVFQVEILRRRAKIAEAPVLALQASRRVSQRIQEKGGIPASRGIQYEVDEVDTK